MIRVSCLLLAAGLSSRMIIGNKLLLKINKITIIEITIENLILSNIDNLYVILGHQSNLFTKILKKFNVPLILNKSYKEGMSSSIKKGIQTIDSKSNGVMICLADMPKIKTNTYNALIKKFKIFYNKKNRLIVVPEHNGENGNPVIFSNHFFSYLENITGDKGAKVLIAKNKKYIKKVNILDDSILKDVDNKKMYEVLLKYE
ncbi:MAG: hypothetical protein CMJ06_06025 [Pelagibacterales bacterium]|nr:hypothetical protein [Pelagibacterales bacterium]OUU61192.1 MAG: hypothetical protein CBC22_08170 [Alphaproteobacteria bacterium TMED62]|tara:strand:- start:6524 stop:7129 length:606 start_codon:yes stop_codon:yes gene_type:complete